MEFCPAFWDWLVHKHSEGIVASIVHVANELQEQNDALSHWAQHSSEFFLTPDEDVQQFTRMLEERAYSRNFDNAAVFQFTDSADQ